MVVQLNSSIIHRSQRNALVGEIAAYYLGQPTKAPLAKEIPT